MRFEAKQLSILVAGLFLAGANVAYAADAAPAQTTDVGTIAVEGAPGGTDTGLIQQEDTPKARSSVNRAFLEKMGGTTNPYQAISLLPGVSTNDYDGTGLFGGTLRVRGFNSDQLGFTINGAPVNDSGSFAVYPQEYVDPENTCSIFVTQGSTDTDAPHVGASGGNVGIVTCDPEDKQRLRVSTELGSNALWKAFVRLDSGKIMDDKFKFFVSYSKAEADKFRGPGMGKKDHIDFKGRYDLGAGSYIDAGYLWNRQLNNNYLAVSKYQLAQNGWGYDLGTVAPNHLVNSPSNAAFNATPGYFADSLNPFENSVSTIQTHIALSSHASFDFDPYFWHGYGTGGNELNKLTEGLSSSAFAGGVGNVYGDAGFKSGTSVYVYEGSVTDTNRPGATTKFNYQLDNQRITVGYWYERAHHRQTGPFEMLDGNGNPTNPWLNDPSLWIRTADGQPLEYRNTLTTSTGRSAFAQDNISLLQDKLMVQLGVRDLSLNRDFFNYAAGGGNPLNWASTGANYEINRTYSKALPSVALRYQFNDQHSAYFNVTENFRAPGNYDYFSLLSAPAAVPPAKPVQPSYVNGVLTGAVLHQPIVQPETSVDYDMGYRFAGQDFTMSATAFYIDFRNRIASAYSDTLQTSVDQNVGDVHQYGFEFESGYKIARDWSLYSSLSYIKAEMQQDMYLGTQVLPKTNPPASVSLYLPTTGKEMPDTPNWLASAHLDYSHDAFNGFVEAKYTGKRYSTLVNDDSVGGYTVWNLGGGYKFKGDGIFKSPSVHFNVLNLFNTHYLALTGPSGSSYANNAYPINQANGGVINPSKLPIGGVPQSPTFYIGAPRSYAITLQADF